jgi:hypothetical protein
MKGLVLSAFLVGTSLTGNSGVPAYTDHGLMSYPAAYNHNLQTMDTSTWQIKLQQDMDALQSLLASADPDWNKVQQTLDQIAQDLDSLPRLAVGERYVKHAGIRHLPKTHPTEKQITGVGGIQIAAGDFRITSKHMALANQIIKEVSLPVLKQTLGNLPQMGTHVVLFSSSASYANALQLAGVPDDQISSIVSETGGLTIGSDVWIPLYNLQNTADLANVLTHELTHVVLNQKGVGDQLPTWINEGIAWYNGLMALGTVDPQEVQTESQLYNQQIQQVVANGELLPLSASEQDILQASYNVEWEDYLAVERLINQYGVSTFQAFLQGISKQGVDASFQRHFHVTRADYEQKWMQSVQSEIK